MSSIGVLQISAAASTERRLTIHAWSPHSNGAAVSATADGISLGSCPAGAGDVTPTFSLPSSLVGRHSITVRLAMDRVHISPDDPRKLGLSVRRIELR